MAPGENKLGKISPANSYNITDDRYSIRTYSFDEEDYEFQQPEEILNFWLNRL